jgi:hypothetical protein
MLAWWSHHNVKRHNGALIPFAYSSHYFQQKGSCSSETRWYGLLMQSIPICILCVAFLMEMLEFHWYNTSNGNQTRGSPTGMVAIHYILRETGAFLTPAHISLADAVCRINRSTRCYTCKYIDKLSSGHIWNRSLSKCSLVYTAWGTVMSLVQLV